MVRIAGVEPARLSAIDFKSIEATVTPYPHMLLVYMF